MNFLILQECQNQFLKNNDLIKILNENILNYYLKLDKSIKIKF